MERNKELENRLYDEIKQNEVCYYLGNAIYRSHDKYRGYTYSVNKFQSFEMFSEAVDHINRSENGTTSTLD